MKYTIALIGALVMAGCSKSESAAGAPSASTARAAPSAAPALGPTCPTGSTGAGTLQDPCKAADAAARIVTVTYTGDAAGEKRTFKFVNGTDMALAHLDLKVYFYDKDGKQLDVTNLPAMEKEKFPNWWTSGLIFGLSGQLDARAEKEVEIPGFQKEFFPAGTATVEAEADLVGFTPCGGGNPCKLYWKNSALVPSQRPKQG